MLYGQKQGMAVTTQMAISYEPLHPSTALVVYFQSEDAKGTFF